MSDSDSFEYKARDSKRSKKGKSNPRPKNKIQREREKEELEELDDTQFGHPRRSYRKKKNKYFDHDGYPLQENDKKAQKSKKKINAKCFQ